MNHNVVQKTPPNTNDDLSDHQNALDEYASTYPEGVHCLDSLNDTALAIFTKHDTKAIVVKRTPQDLAKIKQQLSEMHLRSLIKMDPGSKELSTQLERAKKTLRPRLSANAVELRQLILRDLAEVATFLMKAASTLSVSPIRNFQHKLSNDGSFGTTGHLHHDEINASCAYSGAGIELAALVPPADRRYIQVPVFAICIWKGARLFHRAPKYNNPINPFNVLARNNEGYTVNRLVSLWAINVSSPSSEELDLCRL
ncbi:MAG: hypothetical protein KDD56_06360 [Bdellovibrionales bacterium]|nr:hypothetical protein [Bdellovibrionales bacterium]